MRESNCAHPAQLIIGIREKNYGDLSQMNPIPSNRASIAAYSIWISYQRRHAVRLSSNSCVLATYVYCGRDNFTLVLRRVVTCPRIMTRRMSWQRPLEVSALFTENK